MREKQYHSVKMQNVGGGSSNWFYKYKFGVKSCGRLKPRDDFVSSPDRQCQPSPNSRVFKERRHRLRLYLDKIPKLFEENVSYAHKWLYGWPLGFGSLWEARSRKWALLHQKVPCVARTVSGSWRKDLAPQEESRARFAQKSVCSGIQKMRMAFAQNVVPTGVCFCLVP